MNNVNMTNNHRDREMVDIYMVKLYPVNLSKQDKHGMDYIRSPEARRSTKNASFSIFKSI